MDFSSPQAVDFNEVHELNHAFLALLAEPAEAERLLAGVPAEVVEALLRLRIAERRRLATAPFLLFSLRERDETYWDRLHDSAADNDLFARLPVDSEGRNRLIAAALGFIWQMARQNPYTLRLICCASLHWCERIGEQPLMRVINRAAKLTDVLELRAGSSPQIWRRLLAGSLQGREEIRLATQHSVLQTLLIQPQASAARTWRSAACHTRLPSLSLADDD